MVERRKPRGRGNASSRSRDGSGNDSDADGYRIGYAKPPVNTRFTPGQSGNPKGRRKGTRNLKTDVKRTLAAPVTIRVGDRVRTRSTQEAALMILREKVIHGNERALERLLELARYHNNDELEIAVANPLAEDDRAILAVYVSESTDPPSNASAQDNHSKTSPEVPPGRKKEDIR